MYLVDDKNKCCGCSACAESCPVHALTMVADEEGFAYPVIDHSKCIKCGICERVCSFKPSVPLKEQSYWELKTKDPDVRRRSRSGAAFFELARKVILQNGVVYGVGIVKGTKVQYCRAESLEECITMQGSKYVECSANGIIHSVYDDLKAGKKVLFSGTPCQVAGLLSYLARQKAITLDNLLTVDIICHGVPSQKIYYSYIRFLEKKYKGTVRDFKFRDKTYGWRNHIESFVVNGKTYFKDTYSGMFYSNYFLRPSCGSCPFTSFDRPADITIGDFLGISNVKNGADDNKGVSVVIVNTPKGEAYLQSIQSGVESWELTKELCMQPNMKQPSHIPSNRQMVWDCYLNSDFKSFLLRYGRYDILHKIKWYLMDFPKIKRNKE